MNMTSTVPTSSSDSATSTPSAQCDASTSSLMSELVSYPVLLQHEEALTKQGNAMYDVASWMLYLAEVDSLLETFSETRIAAHAKLQNITSKNMYRNLYNAVYEIGGRTITKEEFTKAWDSLQKARNLISERSLSLLPGSYKLWYDYLQFRSNIYMSSTTESKSIHFKKNPSTTTEAPATTTSTESSSSSSSYPVTSSPHARKYKATLSAYERSLVRMNKYPRIWLCYISFVLHNDPSCNITNIRRLFNRALLALPATQHDLIWSEYLGYILGRVPPNGFILKKGASGGGALGMLGPILQSYQGGILPRMTEGYPIEIPHETVLRVLRRYANYYNPAARELLANTALEFERYGEAASVFCEILNDVDFISVEGTTRHELWMKLAEICTEHPGAIGDSADDNDGDDGGGGGTGIDFEVIVRAVLKPAKSKTGTGGDGRGWDVFDNTKTTTAEGEEDEKEMKNKKMQEQQAQLQASLGEMEGTLWTKLAHYHIRNGEFELARSIYEEAMESVSRVRDFSLIFDGYIKFEEGVIEAMMEELNDDEEEEEEEEKDGEGQKSVDDDEEDVEDLDILLGDAGRRYRLQNADDEEENTSADIELALARAENLMGRRPLLLNRVLLRQNPHNIGEWIKRSDLYLKLQQPRQAIAALEEAIKAVHARKAGNGSPSSLFTTLAGIHEEKMKDIDAARSVYERICQPLPEYEFKDMEDLAQCHTSWVELELRVENWDEALSVARRSVSSSPSEANTRITRSLVRSLQLWNLLLDLEESLGTVQTTKDAYNRALELKVATPSHVLNFASFLKDNKYFEESFTAYERGVDLFPFPNPSAKLIWKDYITAFQDRYSGSKMHRTRELYERCLESCPPKESSDFFILFGKFEEENGLTKRALGVYERMCTTVPAEEKYTAYQLYIAKTIQYIGITATRPLYERAIAALEDTHASKMCSEFAKMESSLQEIDRARKIFTFGAQLADPRRNPEYWGKWHEFEVSHGNEETFREMLRVKRGVQAAFSTVNYNAAEMGAGAPKVENLTDEQALEMIAEREGVNVNETERIGGFVQGKRTAEMKDLEEVERRAAKLRKVTAGLVAATQEQQSRAGNDEEEIDIDDDSDGGDDDEIDIDDDDDDEEDDTKADNNEIGNVSTKAIPAAVFGGLATS